MLNIPVVSGQLYFLARYRSQTSSMFEALELIFTVLLISPSLCIGQGGCEYLFVQQPLAQLDCNPWPYIQQTGYLSLHCDITGPQEDDSEVPNIAWFTHRRDRVPAMSNETQIYLGTKKHSGPTSSADVLNGMKRVNFTLKINNVTSEDIGCYWCRIKVQRSNGCSLMLFQSGTFCLCAVEVYSNLSTCTELPGNARRVCGGNSSCSIQATNDTILVSQSSALAPSIAMTGTIHPEQTVTISYSLESEAGSESPSNGDVISVREDAVRIGLYVGIALCFVLLAVILVMVVGVILLWRRKPAPTMKPQERSRALEVTNGTLSVADTWPPGEGRTHDTSTPRNESRSGVQPSLFHKAQSFDLHDSSTSRIPTGVDSMQDPQCSCNRLSLTVTPEEQSNEDSFSKTEVHYYHVLERPNYYNCPIMSQEGEILGLTNSMRLSWQSISNASMEDLSDFQILPVCKAPFCPGKPCIGTSSSLNPDGQDESMQQKRHIYMELDQSAMKPDGEYTKLIVAK